MGDNSSIQIVAEMQGTSGKGLLHFMNDGYLYLFHSATQSATYFRCKYYRCCPGKVTFYSSRLNVPVSAHNHGPNGISEITYQSYKHYLLNRAMQSTTVTFEDIFLDPCNANHLYTLERLLPSMKQLRQNNLPPCESLRDLSGILSNPNYSFLTRLHQFEDTLYKGFGESIDQSHVILFTSKIGSHFLQMLPFVTLLHFPVPSIHHQNVMCVVAGYSDERNVVPIAWILSEKYTFDALCAAFRLLKSSLTTYNFSKVVCAGDEAGYAFSQVFCVELSPSLYDFVKDIVSSDTGGFTQNSLRENISLGYIVRLCCALPLLPFDKVQMGIDVIINEALLLGDPTYHQAVPIFQYIEEKWLKNPCIKFSMYENVERTSYGSEDLRSRIVRSIQTPSLGFYSLVSKIVCFMSKADLDLTAGLGHNTRPILPIPLLAQTHMRNLLDEVVNPSFTDESAVRNYLLAAFKNIHHLF